MKKRWECDLKHQRSVGIIVVNHAYISLRKPSGNYGVHLTPLPSGNFQRSDPPSPRNVRVPPWGGVWIFSGTTHYKKKSPRLWGIPMCQQFGGWLKAYYLKTAGAGSSCYLNRMNTMSRLNIINEVRIYWCIIKVLLYSTTQNMRKWDKWWQNTLCSVAVNIVQHRNTNLSLSKLRSN